MKNKISFVHAINQALFQFLKKDKKLIVVGLGVDDPKGIFETTLNLKKNFPIMFLICLQQKIQWPESV